MSKALQPGELVVFIPGLLGSVLAKDGREVWGGGVSVLRNLISLGRALQSLGLPAGLNEGDPEDGVVVTKLMPSFSMLPAFWKVDGYDRVVMRIQNFLQSDDVRAAGRLIQFPYDWRLSSRLNAKRLQDRILPELESWRRETQNRDAKLTIVCHSMGGLIARYFLEVLGGRDITSRLVSIGTPFGGSMNALLALSQGAFGGLGRLGRRLDTLVRTFPAISELLPTFPCLDEGGQLRTVHECEVPNVSRAQLALSSDYHKLVRNSLEPVERYRTVMIKGVDQPTVRSAVVGRNGKLFPRHECNGDGTVLRPSAHPLGQDEPEATFFLSQSHAYLQSAQGLNAQLGGILRDHLARFMGATRIGLSVPPVIRVGDQLVVEATVVADRSAPALVATCVREDGTQDCRPVVMTTTDGVHYVARFDGIEAGASCVSVAAASPRTAAEPVMDWVFVWGPEVGRQWR